jgi:hypothetical protein
MVPLLDPRPFAALTAPGLMAFFAAVAAMAGAVAMLDGAPALAAVCAAGFLAATFSGWTGSVQRRDIIRNTATSAASSAALGYVELVGTAQTGPQPGLRSQIRKRPCVWYRYRLQRRIGAAWVTESAAASHECFLLHDDSGDCVVDPEGAEVIPARRRDWREFGYRYHEAYIAPGDRVHVIGELMSITAVESQLDLQADISALLAEWKRDRPELLKRFDRDGNGELEPQEWEAARQAAKEEVERLYYARRALGPLNVVCRPRDARRFMISAYPPEQLTRRFELWAWLHLALFVAGILASAAGAGMIVVR